MKRNLLSAYIRVRTYTTALLLGVAISLTLQPLNLKATSVPQDHQVNTSVPQDKDENTSVPQDICSWIASLFGW